MPGKKLVVIGGGAAGFFCAVNAARLNPQLDVVLVEKTGKLLSKVKVSGGGRCNVTHACFDITAMSRQYPRGGNFVKKTFFRFFTTDTIQWFEKRDVKLKTEKDGRMFPVTDNSQTIIDCLVREAERYRVEIIMKTKVTGISQFSSAGNGQRFSLECSTGKNLHADFICIACGGYPKTAMFDWLTSLGHTIEIPIPSLFTFNLPKHPITELMGVSIDPVRIKVTGTKLEQEGPLLVTHWGMSGPAVLKLSAWGARELADHNWEFDITINWLPGFSEQELGQRFQTLRFELAGGKIINKNPFSLPQRFWEFLLVHADIEREKRWADLTLKEQNRLIKNIAAGTFHIQGRTTFKEEFVTAGGIRLKEIDPQTMMSRKKPNIFFAGEVLDVDGITGGFNFQHAWTSGYIAAQSIAAL